MTEDIWARWLTYRRQGGSTLSPELDKQLHGLRDRVLALASIKDGDTVLDVGCGDGLIGFGALDRVGPPGHVIFSDISADLLGRCKATAEGIGAADRCRFLLAPADDLRDVPTASVDVVTTRSVLIYVSAKSRALAEFFRVLKASGRAAIAEPINRYCFPEPAGTLFGYDVRPIANLAARIADRYDQVETPQIAAMLDFDERDLVTMAERAGFAEIHLDLRIDIEASGPVDWTTFARQAGNPLSPTLEEAMESVLSPSEREQVTAYLKPLVESGAGTTRSAFAFMSALKQ